MCVTRSKKTDSSSGALLGDRALVSLVNNSLEIYHINSPDSVHVSASSSSSSSGGGGDSSSTKKAGKDGKKKAKASKEKKDVEDEAEEEEEDEEEEEEAVAVELIQSSRGELVLKQAVIDLHGHR